MRIVGFGVLFACLSGGCAGAVPAGDMTRAPETPASAHNEGIEEDPADAALEEEHGALAVAEAPVRARGPWIGGAPESAYMLPGDREQMFGVWVDVPHHAALEHVPTALTLAIDTSGSMQGDKILQAREAARRLIDELEDGDMVCIVTFSDRARPLVGLAALGPQTRRHALKVLEELSADGGTALHDGLAVAQSTLQHVPDTHLVRRVVVISDGKATVGPTSPHAMGAIAEHGTGGGVQVTAMGVGLDYDEATLNEMAIRSSGRLYHLAEPEKLPAIIEDEMALLDATVAADVAVEIVPAPGVRLAGLDHGRFEWSGQSIRVPLGAIFAGQERELLVRAEVDHAQLGSRALASLRFHFKDPARGGVARVHEALVDTTVTDDPTLVAEHGHPRTQTIIAMREAAMLALAASRRANSGELAGADADLAQAETALRTRASRAGSARAKKRMLEQVGRISKARSSLGAASRSSGAKRARKSRATALDLNDAAMEAVGY